MKQKRYYGLILGVAIIVIGGAVLMVLKPNKNSIFSGSFEKIDYIDSNFHEFKELIEKSVIESQRNYQDKYELDQWVQIGLTSHHLPTAVSLISDLYTGLLYNKGPRNTFVIIGPDHFERGSASVSTTFSPFATPFGDLEANEGIIDELLEAGVNIDNGALEDEHSIGVQAIFTKFLFPEANFVPLTFKAGTEDQIISDIAKILVRHREEITLIASVDFSHYQSYEYARMLDTKSREMLSNLNFNSFTLEYVDSPASLRLLGLLTKYLQATEITVLGEANSYDFNKKANSTTGYISALFGQESLKYLHGSQTLMFVGDVMLSRSVGAKMERENNWRWPFLKISDYLQKADLLFGNLEGAISDKGIDVGGIYSFRADPRAVEGLKYAGFDVLSVANNHTDDWGQEAMKDTFFNLSNNGLDYVGGGHNEAEAHTPVIKRLNNGVQIAFLAYTNIGSKYWAAGENKIGMAWLEEERLKEDVEKAKSQADIVVVSMHFGEEYVTSSNEIQQFFARAAIDAGADLVVGHHPHVIQEIEKYGNGYIAYSLGNFVFDQNFSEQTTKGMILKAIIDNKRIKEISSVNVKISDVFQPEVIE